mgnify:CR=1 FL=1
MASNAVAITNNKDCERAIKIIGAANSIHDDMRNTLRERFRGVNERKKASSKKDNIGDVFNPEMKRAFLGLPPISQREKEEQEKSLIDHVDKQGSVVKFIAR